MGNHRRAAAIIRGHNRGVIRGGHASRTLYGYIGRNAANYRRVGIVDRDGLRAAAVVATEVCGGVGSLDNELVDARPRDGLVTMRDDWRASAIVGGDDSSVIGR